MKISGKLCINFTVDTDRYKKDYISFLYHVAKDAIEDYEDKEEWEEAYNEGAYLLMEHYND